jgi:glycosyltransferase involved in cell wall biosynthesis
MNPETVSIVIPCFNYGTFIADAIQSALRQTYAPVEVVVVDDGSRDNTPSIVQSFGGRVRALMQENRGVAAARNRGAAESSGGWLCFMDADDTMDVNKIDRQMKWLREDTSLDGVISGWRFVAEDGLPEEEVQPWWEGDILDFLLANRSWPLHCLLIKRSVFSRAGGFFEEQPSRSWPEDTDFSFRIATAGARLRMIGGVLCSWRRHTALQSRSEDIEASEEGFQAMICRLRALQSPRLSRQDIDRYEALVVAAFTARYLVRQPEEARLVTLAAKAHAILGGRHGLAFVRELIFRLQTGLQRPAGSSCQTDGLGGTLGTLRQRLSPAARRTLDAATNFLGAEQEADGRHILKVRLALLRFLAESPLQALGEVAWRIGQRRGRR